MEINEIRKMQELLKTATESINEAMALAIQPQVNHPSKREIYLTQQRPQGSKDDEGWSPLFADVDYVSANEWVDSRNTENALFPMEYRVITIELYLV